MFLESHMPCEGKHAMLLWEWDNAVGLDRQGDATVVVCHDHEYHSSDAIIEEQSTVCVQTPLFRLIQILGQWSLEL